MKKGSNANHGSNGAIDVVNVGDNKANSLNGLFEKSKALIQGARRSMGLMVNTVTVATCFLLGKYMVEEEQNGNERADYGKRVLDSLSDYLTKECGKGFSRINLSTMRRFYLVYRDRDAQMVQKVFAPSKEGSKNGIVQPLVVQLGELDQNGMAQTVFAQSDLGGRFPFKLSWSHYQILLTIEDKNERDFYEASSFKEAWSKRTLKRQVCSSLYQRMALSRLENPSALLPKDTVPHRPEDILKTPFVLEFAGLEDKKDFHENDLENAVINKLQDFLLEMGKGFLFEKRQRRFSFNEENFYLDLVLYNRYLHCYVLIDFKTGKLIHQDLGQMQMYVNYYDRYERIEGENPTIGILMCAKSNQPLVELTLPKDATIFAAEYRLYLPDKELLQEKLKQWIEESDQ